MTMTLVEDIECYGTVVDNNNFYIIADCKDDLNIDETFLPIKPFKNWYEVVDYYLANLGPDVKIYEIHAC